MRRQEAAEFQAVATYTELGGIQHWMDGEGETSSPFFLRQGSHALDRFCTVDIAVTIKDLMGWERLRVVCNGPFIRSGHGVIPTLER